MNPRLAILREYDKAKALPFSWGTADCLSWCADCAKAITGTDPAEKLRGRYESEASAKRVMIAEGWADMGDVARSMYAEIPVAQATSGDWAQIINEDGTETLGVVHGGMIAARTKESGLGQVPLTSAKRAFRVE